MQALALRSGGRYVDATFGRGGHSARILESIGRDGHLLAIDRDPAAIAAGRKRFAGDTRLQLVHGEFSQLEQLVHRWAGGTRCDGVLFDFGVSSPQLDDAARGFSFNADGPLDMRMNPESGQPVSHWLARAPFEDIRDCLRDLGEERFAAKIAATIVRERESTPLLRTSQLSQLVARCVPRQGLGKHPATRTFQALRMYINDELGQIEQGLTQALQVLARGGRLAAISFHSLEDRLVKQFIRRHSETDPALARLPVLPSMPALRLRRLGNKVRATDAEIAANPRSRSAVLRVAECLVEGV